MKFPSNYSLLNNSPPTTSVNVINTYTCIQGSENYYGFKIRIVQRKTFIVFLILYSLYKYSSIIFYYFNKTANKTKYWINSIQQKCTYRNCVKQLTIKMKYLASSTVFLDILIYCQFYFWMYWINSSYSIGTNDSFTSDNYIRQLSCKYWREHILIFTTTS